LKALNVREISVATTEPVTTAYAKDHLRVDITDDDTLIGNLVTAARLYCERYLRQSLVQHTYRAYLPFFYDCVTLPHGPVQSITHIKYYNTDSPSVLTTLASTVYALHDDSVYRNHGETWESTYPRTDSVQITYVTGFADTSSPQGFGEAVPEAVRSAILLIVGDLYENREAKIVGLMSSTNPTVDMLLHPYRNYQ
jgi:uncharacterized phiE125 gp8 family phage protein